MNKITKAILTGAFVAFGVAGTATGATAGTSAPTGPCGFWEDANWAYYNHCASSYVVIRIDYSDGTAPIEQCVSGGEHYLGERYRVANAYYLRTC